MAYVSVGVRLESAFAAMASPQGEDVADADEVKIDQGIFRLLDREATANDVGNGFNLVAVHQCGADADRAGRLRTMRFWRRPRPHRATYSSRW